VLRLEMIDGKLTLTVAAKLVVDGPAQGKLRGRAVLLPCAHCLLIPCSCYLGAPCGQAGAPTACPALARMHAWLTPSTVDCAPLVQ